MITTTELLESKVIDGELVKSTIDLLEIMDKTEFTRFWKNVGKISIINDGIVTLTLAKSIDGSNISYYVGKINEENENAYFRVIFAMEIKKESKIGAKLGYTNLYSEVIPDTVERYKKHGIATYVYQHIIQKEGKQILGDEKHFSTAQKMWSSFSGNENMQIDIADLNSGKVIPNVELNKAEIDKRLWAQDDSILHIRPVLIMRKRK